MKSSRKPSSSKSGARRGKARKKSVTTTARKSATARGRGKRVTSVAKKSSKTPTRARKRSTASAQSRASSRSKAQTKSPARSSVSAVKRTPASSALQRGRGKDAHAPANRPERKALPPQGRSVSRAESTAKPVYQDINLIPGAPVEKPVDPLLIESRMRVQRLAARAPLVPHGQSVIRPLPPRSGKPLWRQPHSS